MELNEIKSKIIDLIDQDMTNENTMITLRGLAISIDEILYGDSMILKVDDENRTNLLRIYNFLQYISLILTITADTIEKNPLEKQILEVLS